AVRRGQEQGGELLTLGPGRLEPRPSLVDAAPGPGRSLAACGLGLASNAGDLAVVVAEHLAEQEDGKFGRIGFGPWSPRSPRGAGEQRLGQPGTDIRLAADAGRTQVVDGQPGGDGSQVRL